MGANVLKSYYGILYVTIDTAIQHYTPSTVLCSIQPYKVLTLIQHYIYDPRCTIHPNTAFYTLVQNYTTLHCTRHSYTVLQNPVQCLIHPSIALDTPLNTLYTPIQNYAPLHSTTHPYTSLYSPLQDYSTFQSTIHCYTVLHTPVKHYTLLYSTIQPSIQYHTLLYSTVNLKKKTDESNLHVYRKIVTDDNYPSGQFPRTGTMG